MRSTSPQGKGFLMRRGYWSVAAAGVATGAAGSGVLAGWGRFIIAPVIGMKNTPTSRLGVDLAVLVLGVDVQHLAALERLPDRDDHPPARLQLA